MAELNEYRVNVITSTNYVVKAENPEEAQDLVNEGPSDRVFLINEVVEEISVVSLHTEA